MQQARLLLVEGQPGDERDWIDAHLVNAALNIHADDPAFAYRFIADELPEKGIMAGENRVRRLCRDHGIWSVFSKKWGLNRKPDRRSTMTWWSGTAPPRRQTSSG